MSFSSDAKAELCAQRPDRKCCAVAESYGVLLYCNTFSAREIRIITASRDFAARLPRLFKRAFSLSFDRMRLYSKTLNDSCSTYNTPLK